jgi:hypothetical protein
MERATLTRRNTMSSYWLSGPALHEVILLKHRHFYLEQNAPLPQPSSMTWPALPQITMRDLFLLEPSHFKFQMLPKANLVWWCDTEFWTRPWPFFVNVRCLNNQTHTTCFETPSLLIIGEIHRTWKSPSMQIIWTININWIKASYVHIHIYTFHRSSIC